MSDTSPLKTANPPEFAQPLVKVRRIGIAQWPWLAIPLLTATLLLQIVLADRARLATDEQWRPRLETLCRTLGCELPTWREPRAFHITSREIRPHPSAAGALLVTATFRTA